MAFLDIIIPLYNNEKRLPKCLNSVLNQSFKDINIIIIDDKSTDNSLLIAKQYQKQFPNQITIIENEKNSGAATSRNKGLLLSKSEYVTFLDSDDYLTPGIFEKVNEVYKKYKPDIIISKLKFEYLGINIGFLGMKRDEYNEDTLYNPRENKECLYKERPSVTGKYYKRETIKTTFPDGLKWEDYAFSIPYLIKAQTIYSIDKPGYIYLMNPFGTTITDMFKIPTRILDIFTGSEMIKNSITKEQLEYYKEELKTTITINCLNRVRDLAFASIIDKKDITDLINYLVNLIYIREGDYRELDWYKYQIDNALFYKIRMKIIEQKLLEESFTQKNEQELILKINSITKKYTK